MIPKILEERSTQTAFVSPKSRIVVMGQNPGKAHLRDPADHPFRVTSSGKQLNLEGSQSWARKVLECIVMNDYKWPHLRNLCNCITDNNDVTFQFVKEYGGMETVEFIDKYNIDLIFCLGSRTTSLFTALYFECGKQDLADFDIINLKHPAWMTRFHSGDVEVQRDELMRVREAIRRLDKE